MAKKQGQLPGTESKKDAALAKKVEEYVDATSEFAKQRHKVTELRSAVLALMHDRKLDTYDDPELDVVISISETKEKLVLKKRDDEGEDDEEGEERAA